MIWALVTHELFEGKMLPKFALKNRHSRAFVANRLKERVFLRDGLLVEYE